MEFAKAMEILALVAGVIFMVMQIMQHKWMWYVNLVAAASALIVALCYRSDGQWAPLWAQVALNAYFMTMATIGIVRWRRWKDVSDAGHIHIVRMSVKIKLISAAVMFVGTPLLWWILSKTNDPRPLLDALSFSFSLLGAWWLARSHIEEWVSWGIADIILIVLYASGAYWEMTAMYAAYAVSCVLGFIHWKRSGVYVD